VILDREGPNVDVGEAKPPAPGVFLRGGRPRTPVIGHWGTPIHTLCQTMPAPLSLKKHAGNTTQEKQGVRVAKDLLQ